MGERSKIEGTDHTFNPWIGCRFRPLPRGALFMSERAHTPGRASVRKRKVPVALSGAYDPCEWRAFNFKGIAGRCDVEPHLIRRVTRSLARKGFAKFERSLWFDDGMPAGPDIPSRRRCRHQRSSSGGGRSRGRSPYRSAERRSAYVARVPSAPAS